MSHQETMIAIPQETFAKVNAALMKMPYSKVAALIAELGAVARGITITPDQAPDADGDKPPAK